MRYVCSICGYVYDEEKEGTPFRDLPETWTCPLCGAAKSMFEPERGADGDAATTTNTGDGAPPSAGTPSDGNPEATYPVPRASGELRELSPGVISAICSNLARGCEKQYHEEEAALYRELADYWGAQAKKANASTEGSADGSAAESSPTESTGADALANLAELLAGDLAQAYPALRAAATEAGDRGTLRICTWGEKVTRALASLVERYRREGPAMLAGTRIWVCSVCGFTFVGERPPELCPVCKVPSWKFDEITGRADA